MELNEKISYYQRRHRLTIPQIAGLREFSGMAISNPAEKQMKLSSLAKVAELIRLSRLFKAQNLNFIPIKGPLLSWRLHQDVTIRYTVDLDILVKPVELFRILEILKQDGYKTSYFDLPDSGRKKQMLLKLYHHIVMMHPQKRIPLEIHWRLMQSETPSAISIGEILKNNTLEFSFHNETFTVFKSIPT